MDDVVAAQIQQVSDRLQIVDDVNAVGQDIADHFDLLLAGKTGIAVFQLPDRIIGKRRSVFDQVGIDIDTLDRNALFCQSLGKFDAGPLAIQADNLIAVILLDKRDRIQSTFRAQFHHFHPIWQTLLVRLDVIAAIDKNVSVFPCHQQRSQ